MLSCNLLSMCVLTGFSEDLTTHEGELITIGFRGNIEADLGQENAEHQLNMDDNNKINSIEVRKKNFNGIIHFY